MNRSHIKQVAALVLATALGLSTLARADDKPDLSRPEEYKKNDEALDKQFRALRDHPQAQPAKADPWGGVRNEASPPVATATKNGKK